MVPHVVEHLQGVEYGSAKLLTAENKISAVSWRAAWRCRQIPNDRIFVVESGIRGKSEILELIDAGADAFLIGESLIQSKDPAAMLRGLL